MAAELRAVLAADPRHAAALKLKERIDAGKGLPQYIKDHAVYYAGPAKTPAGMASGSFGPTTAGRMDSYVDLFQEHGGSMVMLAKGNRSTVEIDPADRAELEAALGTADGRRSRRARRAASWACSGTRRGQANRSRKPA